MTKQQHPFPHPPIVLLHQWMDEAEREKKSVVHHVAEKTAQWASDCELEACCEWMADETPTNYINALRAARRPKPPSLKEQALAELELLRGDANAHGLGFDAPAIRRALESLPE